MKVVAEHTFDLRNADEPVRARIYEPAPEPDGNSWTAWVEIDAPFACRWPAGGVSNLQALIMALKLLSILVYGAQGYRDGKLGRSGRFGGDLGFPAFHLYLDESPFPF